MQSFIKAVVLTIILMTLSPGPLRAEDPLQSSVRIPISDPIYRVLDQLLSFDLMETPIYGVRPWSQKEIQRYLDHANEKWNTQKATAFKDLTFDQAAREVYRQERIEELFKEVDRYYTRWGKRDESSAAYELNALQGMDFEFAYTDAAPHPFLVNAIGSIQANVHPFSEYRQGKPFVKGSQTLLMTRHSAQVSPYATIYAQPYFYFQFPNSDDDTTQVSANELYGRFVWHNVALQVGRSALELGQSAHGGLLLTDNARPLDGIQLMNDAPFRLPSLLSHIGQWRLLFHIETLGPNYVYKNSLFSGLKIQLKPIQNLELGFGYSIIFGGQGAPSTNSISENLTEYFGGFIGFISNTDTVLSNRIVELDIRATLPKWRGLQIYAEGAIDDKTQKSYKSTFGQRSGYRFGFYLPRLNDSGTADLRFEWAYLSQIVYRHGSFPYTENNQIMGDPLGPQGMEESLTLGYALNQKIRIENRMTLSLRDSDTYGDNGTEYVKLSDNPREVFLSWRPTVHYQLNNHTQLYVGMGYQRAFNAAYVQGSNENQFLAQAQLSFVFPEQIRGNRP